MVSVILLVCSTKENFKRQIKNKFRIKLEFDSSNYVTKSNLKNATGADTSDFAKRNDLAATIHKIFETNSNFYIDKIFILAGRLGTRLSLCQV